MILDLTEREIPFDGEVLLMRINDDLLMMSSMGRI